MMFLGFGYYRALATAKASMKFQQKDQAQPRKRHGEKKRADCDEILALRGDAVRPSAL
jgi:hypothetical protein